MSQRSGAVQLGEGYSHAHSVRELVMVGDRNHWLLWLTGPSSDRLLFLSPVLQEDSEESTIASVYLDSSIGYPFPGLGGGT